MDQLHITRCETVTQRLAGGRYKITWNIRYNHPPHMTGSKTFDTLPEGLAEVARLLEQAGYGKTEVV